MSRLRNLNIKRLLKELEFIEIDYEYRSELLSNVDSDFMNCVDEFLSKNTDLKDIYDKKVTDRIDKTINQAKYKVVLEIPIDVEDDNVGNGDIVPDEKSPELKKVYREIVKLTHPDKVSEKKLNDYYIKSTELYNDNDKIGLYKVCDDLGIEYEIDENDTEIIEDKINTIKRKINFIESTFTWKWFNTKDEKVKEKILLDFISLKIS